MLLKKLYLNIILRTIGIVANSLLIAYIVFRYFDLVILINLIVLLLVQVYLFIKSVNKINYDLENFFIAIKNSDTSISFKNKSVDKSFESIYHQFDRINNDLKSLRIEIENRNIFLKSLVEQIEVGIFAFNQNGEVTIYNSSAQKILKKPLILHISELEKFHPFFYNVIKSESTSIKKLIPLGNDINTSNISVQKTTITFSDETIHLISFQNIKSELDQKEVESWQKLIRVLTHEIMNSVAPINSTVDTLTEIINDTDIPDKELMEDTADGLKIINDRSLRMLDFVKNFRSFTLSNKPKPTEILVPELFNDISHLLNEELKKKQIELVVNSDIPNHSINVDRSMIDQILINLIKNSMEALDGIENKKISLSSKVNSNKRTVIEISDNGCGIPQSVLSEIFVPFFTTKEEGSGVGLSLSRQFMQMHGGDISVHSVSGKGTIVRLLL